MISHTRTRTHTHTHTHTLACCPVFLCNSLCCHSPTLYVQHGIEHLNAGDAKNMSDSLPPEDNQPVEAESSAVQPLQQYAELEFAGRDKNFNVQYTEISKV